jgi:hypothetical protein
MRLPWVLRNVGGAVRSTVRTIILETAIGTDCVESAATVARLAAVAEVPITVSPEQLTRAIYGAAA